MTKAAGMTKAEPKKRRRGEELEAALLDAAWAELTAVGFARLTMESVAARAQTGVAVLYRRWPRKDDLVLAAIRHHGQTHPVEVPDTGNLHDDMVAVLESINENRVELATIVSATLTGLHESSGLTPAEIREQVRGDARSQARTEEIFRRAHDRGEIDLAGIPADVLALPFDLIRHDILMTLKPIPPERITAIVDDIFWPLVTAAGARGAPPRPSLRNG
jgi:AcrR family transcriptional regulator